MSPYRVIYVVKSKFLFVTGSFFSALFTVLNKYVFDDWQFLAFLSVAIIADTVLGFMIAWNKQEVSISNGFSKIFKKCIIYACFLMLTHVLAGYTVHGVKNIFFYWFTTVGYAVLMIAEGSSILRNMNILKPGTAPKWLMKRFKEFNEKGLPHDDKPAGE